MINEAAYHAIMQSHFIFLSCENKTILGEDGICENVSALKEGQEMRRSAWSRFWDNWKFIGWG